jgi:hypothetical protein
MLDSSRRLRVDEPNRSIFLHGLGGRIGADGAPIIQRPADQKKLAVPADQVDRSPPDPPHESSFVVYCGNVQEVSEGFAIALRAMGVEANFSQADIALPAISPNTEDN